MAKDEMVEGCFPGQGPGGKGMMVVLAALLLAVGMMGGAFLLSKGDYAPKVDLSGFKSNPNVYVTSSPTEHAISVSASATQKVEPDLLQISLRVQTESPTAKDAQSENAQVTAILMGKIKALGIAEKDIQTTSYSVDAVTESNYTCDYNGYNCRYNYYTRGYRTTHSLLVNVEALDKGGQVIDAASEAGVNQTFVDGTSFTLKETTRSAIAKTLLKTASVEARSKAQNIADGLGTTLGKLLYANENNVYYPQPYYNSYKNMAMDASAAAPTQLSPGTVEVSTSVAVSYEIG